MNWEKAGDLDEDIATEHGSRKSSRFSFTRITTRKRFSHLTPTLAGGLCKSLNRQHIF